MFSEKVVAENADIAEKTEVEAAEMKGIQKEAQPDNLEESKDEKVQ